MADTADDLRRSPYIYAEPVDAAEASARIEHWLGDITEFQEKLGLQPMGYHVSRSGLKSGTTEQMWSIDELRHPMHRPGMFWTPKDYDPLYPDPVTWISLTKYRLKDFKTRVDSVSSIDKVKVKANKFVDDRKARLRKKVYDYIFGWILEDPDRGQSRSGDRLVVREKDADLFI